MDGQRIGGGSGETRQEQLLSFSRAQAEKYSREGNYARAFPHLLLVGQLDKEVFREEKVDDFLSVVLALVNQLETSGREDRVEQVYNQALDLLPEHPALLTNYGSHLFNGKQFEKAEAQYRAALMSDPDYLEARDRLENLASSLVERWHFPMLNDRRRNLAFKTAIEGRMRGGCRTVLDVGTGTGLLSLMAAMAGADRVYACEAQEVMAVTARDVLQHNEAGSVVRLIPKLSLDLTDEDVPEKLDLLVTETFDSGLLGEHVLETLTHAWSNLLEEGVSRVVPCKAEFIVAPIESDFIARGQDFSLGNMGYLSTKKTRVISDAWTQGTSEPYTTERLTRVGYKLLAPPSTLFTVNLESLDDIKDLLEGEQIQVDFRATQDGRLDGVAGWFNLHLDETTALSTQPSDLEGNTNSDEDELCWEQVVFKVTTPRREVVRGQTIIAVEFMVKKHVELQQVEVRQDPSLPHDGWVAKLGGGQQTSRDNQQVTQHRLTLPTSSVKLLNSSKYQETCQWVSYHLATLPPTTSPLTLLDLTKGVPLLPLQVLQLRSSLARLTLLVDSVGDTRGSRQLLDWVTGVARENCMDVSTSVDCITKVPAEEGSYSVVLVAPVLGNGRLDQEVLLGMEQAKRCLSPGTGLLLPFRLEVWCCVLESPELATYSHLVNNEPVLGFRIADQVNILAVSHQQSLVYQTLVKTELTSHTMVTDLDLTCLDLKRKQLTREVPVTKSGLANAVAYWFVQDFGWNVKLNSLESEGALSQAAFISTPTRVEEGGKIEVCWQTEKGLIHFKLGS